MAFETFDLGRAYSDAARIKALEADTVDRTRRTDLYEQSLTSQSQEAQQTAQLQEKWAELQASKKNSVWRAKIAAEIRAGAPQFADRDDDELITYAEAGIAQKLGIQQTPKDIGTLYATGEEGILLPADQAMGKSKYQEPKEPKDKPISDKFRLWQELGGDPNDKAGFRAWLEEEKDDKDNAPSDTAYNSIKSTIFAAYGGTYDPRTGEYAFTNKTQMPQAVRAISQAQQYLRDNPGTTPGQAADWALYGKPGEQSTGGRGGARPARGKAPASPAQSATPPASILKEGVISTLKVPGSDETQRWTLRAGQPVRVD